MKLQLFRDKGLSQESLKEKLFLRANIFLPRWRSGELEAQVFFEIVQREEIYFVLKRKRMLCFELALSSVLKSL
jgi:hypothetical protein